MTAKKSRERKLREIEFTTEGLRAEWKARPVDGRIFARELGGRLGLRGNKCSLAVVCSFYSSRLGRTVPPESLYNFESPAEITDAALDKIREAEKQFIASFQGRAGAEQIEKAKAGVTLNLGELFDLYFASPEYAELSEHKGRGQQINKNFLEYYPPRRRANGKLFLNQDGSKRYHKWDKFRFRKFENRAAPGSPPVWCFFTEQELEDWRDEKVPDAKKPFVFNRTLQYSQTAFKWLVEEKYLPKGTKIDVTRARERDDIRVREYLFSPIMIRAMWEASEDLHAKEKGFVRLLMLTCQRRQMIAGLEWDEIRNDMELPQIDFPKSRVKNKKSYVLPLTPAMQQVLDEMKSGEQSHLVFPASSGKPISNFSSIQRRLEKRMIEIAGDDYCPGWRFHDLRRFARTTMASLRIHEKYAVLCLGHTPKRASAADKHYDKYGYLEEKLEALRDYNKKVMQIVKPEEHVKEIPAKATGKDDLTRQLAAMAPAERKAIISQFLG
ncbi:tyrosine-type recombinase/integrase [Marinicaulis aureus]|uniref:Tyrosine-type recombinase/integrase n=1 Tax=Hyphococcus aureus TaxID=2666033 RepID=A0ABW1KY19_9PROT